MHSTQFWEKSVFRLITKGRDTNQIAKSDLKKISNLSQFEPTWTTLGTDLTTLLTSVNCIFSGGPEEFKGDKSQNIGLDTATFTFTVTSNPKPRSLGVFSKGMMSEIDLVKKYSFLSLFISCRGKSLLCIKIQINTD